MDETSMLEIFDLKPEEAALRLLYCGPDLNPKLPIHIDNQAVVIDPKLLSRLPFPDQAFDLALCEHCLFLHHAELPETLEFQLQALMELVRVASEVRIIPLVDKQGQPFKDLGHILQALQERSIGVELRDIKQGKGGALLRLWSPVCVV